MDRLWKSSRLSFESGPSTKLLVKWSEVASAYLDDCSPQRSIANLHRIQVGNHVPASIPIVVQSFDATIFVLVPGNRLTDSEQRTVLRTFGSRVRYQDWKQKRSTPSQEARPFQGFIASSWMPIVFSSGHNLTVGRFIQPSAPYRIGTLAIKLHELAVMLPFVPFDWTRRTTNRSPAITAFTTNGGFYLALS